MNEHDPITVKVSNPEDFKLVTVEHEPEHFSFTTVTLTPGQQSPLQCVLLALDPLRKSAAILPIDAAIVLCDSPAQAAAAGNQMTGFPAPDGAYTPQGVSVTVDGTGPVWGACQTATRVSVIINRRKS